MGSFSAYLGKGLSEPCSPYRQANFFGAALNSPNAAWWNCLPNIVGSTINFDLSGITENHEVCVALATIRNTLEGLYSTRFVFYKETPYTKLWEYTYSLDSPGGWGIYAYAYIGWTYKEINENGDYFVDITVEGPESFNRRIDFTITGIPVAVPPPPPSPVPTSGIVEAFNSVSSFFYSIYFKTLGWSWPFNEVSSLFYGLAILFSTLALAFSDFITLVNSIISQVANVLSWGYIKSLIKGWLPWLENAGTWFQNWWTNIWNEVEDWWDTEWPTVKGWITAATQGLASLQVAWSNFWNDLWPELASSFDSLKSSWDNFWRVTFPNLVSFKWLETWWNSRVKDVEGLINSAFTTRDSLWAGWQEMKDKVVTFFADPVEFVWSRFTDWFLGPEG